MESTSNNVNVDEDIVSKTPFVSGSGERTKKEISSVWNFFTKIGKDKDDIERAVCNYCSRDYAVGKNPTTNNNYGTSHLGRHILSCKSIADSSVDVNPNQDGKSCLRKINQKTHREKLAKAIIKHDLPFNFVEYEGIRDWINYLNPDVVMPSRNTIVSDVKKVYIREKEKLKQMMFRIPNRICLTLDVWTATTTEGYMCLTAHFVDENWKLASNILNFCRMKPPHTGVELEASVFNCLKQWGIDKKVFSITLDNASANKIMQNLLKNHLLVQSNLLCDGEFFHVRCSAHILNIIVQEGLKVANEALYKIRESVKYVRASDGRMLKFRDCVSDAGTDISIGLRLDVTTRWNSTYLMLQSAIKYEKAFDIFQAADRSYNYCPSYEEWRRGEKMCHFLEPFYEMTNIISGSSYPTSNMYFMRVWQIECILEENLHNDDDVIKEMTLRMKKKFDKYWKEYSVVLAFRAILDPRLKIGFIKYCYTHVDPSTSEDRFKNVKEKFKKLFEEYASNFPILSASLSQSSNESSLLSKSHEEGTQPKRSKIISGYKVYKNETNAIIGKTEMDEYLEEKEVDDDIEDFDVLQWWKANEKKFPILSIMARDVLSIPITTLASESAFSIGGRVLTKYRSSTLPEHVQMLICSRSWLHGFSQNPSDEDEYVNFGHEAAETDMPKDVED